MKADFHIHTKYSGDSTTTPKQVLRAARARKLNMVAITDHNTIRGAAAMKKTFRGSDIKLIIGEEVFTDHKEIIGLGINEELPKGVDFLEAIDKIREQGGKVVIPHPFDFMRIKEAVFDKELLLSVRNKIDFVEINGRCLPFFNELARRFAKRYDFNLIAGSDAHFDFEIGRACCEADEGLDVKRVFWPKNRYLPIYANVRTKLYKMLGVLG